MFMFLAGQRKGWQMVSDNKVGNEAALREALSYARNVLAKWSRDTPFRAWNEIGAAIDKCDAALAEPPESIGNNAKMRDALVWLQKTGHRTPEGGWMCITLKMTQKDGMPHPIEVPPYAEDVINAALSTPPRNCDRFNSGDATKDAADAYDEWQRHCDCSLMPPSCKVESAFRQWLFAKAKSETKGETNGSK